MPISIKDAETDRLARALAQETGETLTEAIRLALLERLERHRAAKPYPRLAIGIRRVQERVAQLPVLDPRAADTILGYDDFGLPR